MSFISVSYLPIIDIYDLGCIRQSVDENMEMSEVLNTDNMGQEYFSFNISLNRVKELEYDIKHDNEILSTSDNPTLIDFITKSLYTDTKMLEIIHKLREQLDKIIDNFSEILIYNSYLY